MASCFVLPSLIGRRRLPDADTRLQAYLLSCLGAVFGWGRHDCALFAAGAVAAQLGVDPAEPLRYRYDTAWEATALLRQAGGINSLVTSVLGQPLAAPMLARIGDIGLTDAGSLAVCTGEHWSLPTRHGMGQLPLRNGCTAWRVGNA